ncbi:hypothetical protein H2198_002568 [Neophaeococcomyces mojaviensis]|uniref:Uncharacterized protein n=1 Tax=Neophaeococcomyces mojaviensis TaxID=3383035 RepID=A0ACC3ADW5_9EURO|nr:hypothetical protein H2198_002568 [Knufia sp. JES_112]
MSTTYTLVSWGITLALVLGAIHVFRPDLTQRVLSSSISKQAPSSSATTKSTTKRQKAKKPQAVKDIKDVIEQTFSADQTSSKEARTSKKRKITGPVGDKVTATAIDGQKKELPRDVENSLEDGDFAAQLKKAQAGTSLQSKPPQKAPASTRLASTLQPSKSEEMLSTTERSSTTGQDADDDMSSVDSVIPQPTSSGRNINDMLEAPAPAPTTLRLTNVSNEQQKPKQSNKQFEQIQSKKKRNEQKRREDQKREIEESNRLWEQKKQEQLRTARMAAGTSNQTKANAFASTTTNAWQNKSQPATNGQSTAVAAPLLDTFDTAGSQPAAEAVRAAPLSTITDKPLLSNNVNALKSQVGDKTASALAASEREQQPGSNWAQQMSEEEQIQRLREQQNDDAWESVTSKKSKKNKRPENDTSSETSSVPPPVQVRAPRPQTYIETTNGVSKPKQSVNRFESMATNQSSSLQDDEWQA